MDTARLDALLAAARRMGASALHLVPGRPPALRVPGHSSKHRLICKGPTSSFMSFHSE